MVALHRKVVMKSREYWVCKKFKTFVFAAILFFQKFAGDGIVGIGYWETEEEILCFAVDSAFKVLKLN
jgi:hypothetical protein